MKIRNLIAATGIVLSLSAIGAPALAAHKTTTAKTTTVAAKAATTPSYCGTTPYDVSYRAVYQYPTGSYWQTQIAAYPAYYAANNAYYLSAYGC